jgi:Flp pilus assembly pilin Flp
MDEIKSGKSSRTGPLFREIVIAGNRVARDPVGQDLVEYALLVAVVALGAVAALNAFKAVIGAAWTAISANLST